MADILRIKGEDGLWHEIPAIVGPAGPAGPKGETGAKGDKGDKGDTGLAGADYVLTAADKAEIAQTVLAALPNAHGVAF